MLYAIAVLFAFQLLGEFLVRISGLPLPGALVGTLLLLIGLLFYKRLPKPLEDTAQVLLQNMMLLFIPVIAGVMLILIIILLFVKPSDETLEDVGAATAAKKEKKAKKSKKE